MFYRQQMDAPFGWDSVTEMTANVVDAVNYLARLFFNANSEKPDTSPLPRVKRPFETEQDSASETISLAEFGKLI
jgi:hypothetical protein